ncbi:hypothetical protein [Dictyobacter halimunensis]
MAYRPHPTSRSTRTLVGALPEATLVSTLELLGYTIGNIPKAYGSRGKPGTYVGVIDDGQQCTFTTEYNVSSILLSNMVSQS